MTDRVPRTKCQHTELQFGSGDYYLFCHACGAWWAMIDPETHLVIPEQSNQATQSVNQLRRIPT